MAILAENEPLPANPVETTSGTQPTESVIKLVKKMMERSKLGTQEYRKQWPTNYKFVFSGQQWPLQRPEYRFSEVVNTTWADIMTEVGIQTDAKPKVDYVAAEPSDIPFCDILKEINDQNWSKYPWLQRVAENVLDSKWCHVSHTLVEWDPELEHGLGDVSHKILDPYGCYWDPLATCEDDLRYFIYMEPTPTEKLKSEYPQFESQITGDIDVVGYNYQYGKNVDFQSDQVGFNLSNGIRGRRYAPDNRRYGGEEMTFRVRCWIKDDTVVELIDEKQVDTGEIKKEYVLKKQYPQGRYIEFCNNVLLKDGPNGVECNGEIIPYKHGKIPVVRWVNYSYPREYAGENEVSHSMGPQIITNYVWSFILDTMKQASNPKEIFSSANQEAADKSSNEPGQVLVLPDYAGYRREPGQGIPPNLNFVLQSAESLKDKITGLQDVMRGAVDPAVKSGILMDSYVEAAQVRPRLKARNMDQSLYRLGFLDASLYLQFYTAQRTYQITNKQGWPEFVSFFVGDDGQGGHTATINRTVMHPVNGPQVQPQQQLSIKGIPDIRITTGSSIPFQKGVQYQRDKELFQLGAIDQEALLKDIDYPKADEILQRMAKAQQAAQAAQQGGQ